MGKNVYLDETGAFIIKQYNSAYPFSNFLPALAGEWGIPLWAFYVNRGQAMISFGVHDKNHAIAEFFPADRAYRLASTLSFRTFIKINGNKVYEPFQLTQNPRCQQIMRIRSHDLRIDEYNPAVGLRSEVTYFTLPQCSYPALIRSVALTNTGSKKVRLSVLDGLPRVIPFNLRDLLLKHLSRTMEAWMRSDIQRTIAIFSLLVDPRDAAQTQFVKGAHFYYSLYQQRGLKAPRYIVDPVTVFGDDTSLHTPLVFARKNFSYPAKQITCGRTPCGFGLFEFTLRPGERREFFNLWGGVFDRVMLKEVRKVTPDFIRHKEKENARLIQGIKQNAFGCSGYKQFDHYVQSTYMDNILRGGLPYSHKRNKVYYIFSRKHGDLERDYNKFKILATHFSEGEANYRDVNQNRRMDLFFNPFIEKSGVVYFLNLIKMNGYNPLVVRGEKLYFDSEADIRHLVRTFGIKKDQRLTALFKEGFYLGELLAYFADNGIIVKKRVSFIDCILSRAKRRAQASFGEGYWIDHWRYNLDIIESFLYFYPDKLEELFFETEFMFWDDAYRVKKQRYRYILKNNRVYQYNSVEHVPEKEKTIQLRTHCKNFLREAFGRGDIVRTNLTVKFLSVILNKAASLDPHGLGIEMEADKPGWCDSLNGLPALFGSSFCETLELKRALKLLLGILQQCNPNRAMHLPAELCEFFKGIKLCLDTFFKQDTKQRDYLWWQQANTHKEAFREATFLGINGSKETVLLREIQEVVALLLDRIQANSAKAKDAKSGLFYSYFSYTVKEYDTIEGGFIHPKKFVRHNLPLFLESSVHALRTEDARSIVAPLRSSVLFDAKLKMYRLNAPLDKEPLEIGRSRVFPPGWLENESIWLHMEYKYLLELLKRGCYREFYRDLFNCAVCFFDPATYGRSILENSSFLVSSAHPDASLWGKGFVARLTGATVEFLAIWILMCLGHRPFFTDASGSLCIEFSPLLKKEFFTRRRQTVLFKGKPLELEANTFSFTLFSSILVVYHNLKGSDTFSLSAQKVTLRGSGINRTLHASVIREPLSTAIREKKIQRIDVYLK